MRTSLNIPEELLEEAKNVGNTQTKTQAVLIALSEFIARRKSRKILELKGTLKEDPEYKKSRKKR